MFTPHELIERLVAIVPRPRAHLTRYFGVFAPAFAARAGIVPSGKSPAPSRRLRAGEAAPAKVPKVRNRLPWATLIWRVFLKDVLECARCKGRMEVGAPLTSRPAIERVLRHLGLPAEPPDFHPARPPPQVELPFGDEALAFIADAPAPDDVGA